MPAFEHCQTCIKTFHVRADEAPIVPEGKMCGACMETQNGQLEGLGLPVGQHQSGLEADAQWNQAIDVLTGEE